jgi:hypothetical protein
VANAPARWNPGLNASSKLAISALMERQVGGLNTEPGRVFPNGAIIKLTISASIATQSGLFARRMPSPDSVYCAAIGEGSGAPPNYQVIPAVKELFSG